MRHAERVDGASDVATWVGAIGGLVGAVTGVWALVWQARSRRRSAHNIIVKSHASLVLTDAPGLHMPMTSVAAHNVGANAVTITGWGVEVERGHKIVTVNPVYPSAAVPYRLEAGEQVTFYFMQSKLAWELQRVNASKTRARPYVDLATLERIYGKRGVSASL